MVRHVVHVQKCWSGRDREHVTCEALCDIGRVTEVHFFSLKLSLKKQIKQNGSMLGIFCGVFGSVLVTLESWHFLWLCLLSRTTCIFQLQLDHLLWLDFVGSFLDYSHAGSGQNKTAFELSLVLPKINCLVNEQFIYCLKIILI